MREFLIAAVLVMLTSGVAHATTIYGVEFTDPVIVDVGPGEDLYLSGTEDIYVYVPFGLDAVNFSLGTLGDIYVGTEVVADVDEVLALCAGPQCVTRPGAIASDVIVRILNPVGDIFLEAGGSGVIDVIVIPEASSALLVLVGLGYLSLRRSRTSRGPRSSLTVCRSGWRSRGRPGR